LFLENMIKKFYSNLFYVSDIKKTSDFYRELDFDVEESDDGTARINFGEFKLAFIQEDKVEFKDDSNKEPKGLGLFIYIGVDNVDEYFKLLKSRDIKYSSEPRDWPWGKREFVVRDPDGYKLVFFSPIKK